MVYNVFISFKDRLQVSKMNNPNKTNIKIIFYISTGAKDVYYTLNKIVQDGAVVISHSYVQNLSMEENEAVEKAEAFAKRLYAAGVDCVFDGTVDGETYGKLGSNLSVEDHFKVKKIKEGLMPFGKHRDQPIKNLPFDYICWIISKFQSSENAVENTLAFATLAIALENQILKSDDDILECLTDFNKKNSKSDYIAEKGERLDIKCEVYKSSSFYDDFRRQEIYNYLLKQGDNLITYYGTVHLGEIGESINIKATIKNTYESKGVKYTGISRPKII